MSLKVAVAGASGYAGGEVVRLLLGHPEFELTTVSAAGNAGCRMGEVHPHLSSISDMVLQETTPQTLANHDVVFLAVPHGQSGELAASMKNDALIVDCGADHRPMDPDAWKKFYASDYAGSWPYGLPELLMPDGTQGRDHLTDTQRIAVPGCNATAIILALAPGLRAGVISSQDITAVLANGYSGAGKTLKVNMLASEALGSATPYSVGGIHRHIPEIAQALGIEPSFTFVPTLVPMARGILATLTAQPTTTDRAAIRGAWEQAYRDEEFIHVLPVGQWPATSSTLGSNSVHLQVDIDEASGRVIIIAAIDNLGKGTAGAAIQSANIACGWAENTGLTTTGVAP